MNRLTIITRIPRWITHERIAVATMTLLSAGVSASVLSMAASPKDAHLVPVAAGFAVVLVGLTIAFYRGWQLAGPLCAIALSLAMGLNMPEPFLTQYAPAIVVLPQMIALLLAPPLWTLGAGGATVLMLMARADFTGVYTEPTTIILMTIISGTVLLSRLLVERSLEEARALNRTLEERVAARTAELEEQKARVQRLLVAKQEMYSTVAHDLRHDVTTASSLAQLLGEAWEAGDREEAELQARRLYGVLHREQAYSQDLTDVSLLAEGETLPLRPAAVQLPDLAARLADELAVEAELYGIAFTVAVKPGTPVAWCDPQRTERVIRNLLGNALKAIKWQGGGGLVSISIAPGGAGVRCAITDTGVGIAPDDLCRLGQRFQQTRSSTEAQEGTGLGLSLTMQLLALMHGTFEITSPGAGLGATAAFSLPLYREEL